MASNTSSPSPHPPRSPTQHSTHAHSTTHSHAHSMHSTTRSSVHHSRSFSRGSYTHVGPCGRPSTGSCMHEIVPYSPGPAAGYKIFSSFEAASVKKAPRPPTVNGSKRFIDHVIDKHKQYLPPGEHQNDSWVSSFKDAAKTKSRVWTNRAHHQNYWNSSLYSEAKRVAQRSPGPAAYLPASTFASASVRSHRRVSSAPRYFDSLARRAAREPPGPDVTLPSSFAKASKAVQSSVRPGSPKFDLWFEKERDHGRTGGADRVCSRCSMGISHSHSPRPTSANSARASSRASVSRSNAGSRAKTRTPAGAATHTRTQQQSQHTTTVTYSTTVHTTNTHEHEEEVQPAVARSSAITSGSA